MEARPAPVRETASAVSSTGRKEPRVFGAHITPYGLSALANVIVQTPPAPGEGVRCVFTMNLYHVVVLEKDLAFRDAYDAAWAVTLDGAPVAAFANLKGVRRRRITGSDLMPVIVERLDPHSHRPFFIVSDLATEGAIRGKLNSLNFDDAAIGFAEPPYGFEHDAVASAELAAVIRQHGATHIFMSVGAPKSEVWLHRHQDVLGDAYGLCFGSGANYLAGTKVRAPRILQRLGLEWAFRLATEPKRLWRRYLISSWAFVQAVAADWRQA